MTGTRVPDFSKPPTGRCWAQLGKYPFGRCSRRASTWRSGAAVCGTHARSTILLLSGERDV